MSTGRYTSDLDVGDVFAPKPYDVTPFPIREYCHSLELHQEIFQGADGQAWPVTLVHMDKLRFYHEYCPKGSGPNARIHYEFDASWSRRTTAGDRLIAEGRVARRYVRRDREYMEVELELRDTADNEVVVRYKDTTVLSYRAKDAG
jgi:hypothetical protein